MNFEEGFSREPEIAIGIITHGTARATRVTRHTTDEDVKNIYVFHTHTHTVLHRTI